MDILFITHILNALLAIAIPIGLAIYLKRRYNHSWTIFFAGVVVFILAQVGHIPFNILLTTLFQRGILPSPPENYQLLFNAVVLGLSAALWEELFRYGSMRWWLGKDVRTWSKALFFGNGWGGIEAIILVGGLGLVGFFQMVALRTADLSGFVPPEQLELARQQVAQYWSMPWYMSLMGAYERIWAIVLQILLTVLVLQVFTRRKMLWLWLAIGLHALVDFLAVYVNGTWGVLASEALLTVIGLLALGLIFYLRTPEPVIEYVPEAPAEDAVDATNLVIAYELEPSEDQIDDSRYQSPWRRGNHDPN